MNIDNIDECEDLEPGFDKLPEIKEDNKRLGIFDVLLFCGAVGVIGSYLICSKLKKVILRDKKK